MTCRWVEMRLGDALDVSHGFAFRGEHFSDEGELVILTPGNFLESGGFKDKSGKEKYYLGEFPERYRLSRGDVVVAMTEQSKGLLGSTATLPSDGRYLHNQRIGLLTVSDESRLSLRFAYHALNGPTARAQIQSTATGSKVRHTAPERIEAVVLPVPDVEEQQQIAVLLDTFDELIENNRRRIEILEEMARLLYREWFVHFRFPGHEDVDLVDSELGPIPEGWDATSLADHCTLKKRNVKPQDFPAEDFLHFSIPAFDAARLPAREPGDDIKSGKYGVTQDCVLLSKLNPRFPRVWRVDPPGQPRSICSTEFLVLEKAEQGWPLDFVQGLVGGSDFGQRLAQMAGGTSTSHQRVKPGDVMALPVAGPPETLVVAYSEQVGPMIQLSINLTQQNRILREARDLLLPRLVSGELDVSELDLDGVLA